jgi:hypothetical protein
MHPKHASVEQRENDQIFQTQIPRLPPKNMYISVLDWCVICIPNASPTTAFHGDPYFLSSICFIALADDCGK